LRMSNRILRRNRC